MAWLLLVFIFRFSKAIRNFFVIGTDQDYFSGTAEHWRYHLFIQSLKILFKSQFCIRNRLKWAEISHFRVEIIFGLIFFCFDFLFFFRRNLCVFDLFFNLPLSISICYVIHKFRPISEIVKNSQTQNDSPGLKQHHKFRR